MPQAVQFSAAHFVGLGQKKIFYFWHIGKCYSRGSCPQHGATGTLWSSGCGAVFDSLSKISARRLGVRAFSLSLSLSFFFFDREFKMKPNFRRPCSYHDKISLTLFRSRIDFWGKKCARIAHHDQIWTTRYVQRVFRYVKKAALFARRTKVETTFSVRFHSRNSISNSPCKQICIACSTTLVEFEPTIFVQFLS